MQETISKKIWVTFQKPGIHRYPSASHEASLSDVAYLGHPHRHLFKFKVSIEVYHNDRELEFHQFLNWIEALFSGTLMLDYKSCEMIADDLYQEISKKYPSRDVEIEVSEDGECGIVAKYNKAVTC